MIYIGKKQVRHITPFQIIVLTKTIILDQTKYQYPFYTVYEQECYMYSFSQNTLSNEQWCEPFSTKIDVGSAIGVIQQ